MIVTSGKVRGGNLDVDVSGLPEGTTVVVLAPEGDETFDLDPDQEAKLLAAIEETNRGELVDAAEVMKRLPQR
jgi:hypothetical protein